jgi:phage replication O-like protein O
MSVEMSAKHESATNYTKTPNVFFDDLLPQIESLTELKVTLAILRKTNGWQKTQDTLSLSLLQTLTGLSRQGVLNGIEEGMKRGTITRKEQGQSFSYGLKIVNNTDRQLVNDLDQSIELTSQRNRPEVVNDLDRQLVNNLDTQKKEEKEKKEKKKDASASSSANADRTAREKPKTPGEKRNADIREVFDHWRTVLEHSDGKFTDDRRRKIGARLTDGYTMAQLKRAIDGCRASPHHRGENPQGTIYDSIELIFRNGEKVEQFIGYLEAKGNHGNAKSQTRGGNNQTEVSANSNSNVQHLLRNEIDWRNSSTGDG